MKTFVQLTWLLLMASFAVPQIVGGAAEIRKVSVAPDGDKVTVEVRLTASVIPDVIIATNPDRLVLQLPNTSAPRKQQAVTLNQNGVKEVRLGLNRASPPIARVVVDLKTAHPYQLAMSGNTITLTVLPTSTAVVPSRLKGPVGNGGGGLARIWRRQSNAADSTKLASGTSLVAANQQPAKALRTRFIVKYVAEGAAYLNGGRSSGLVPGMKLAVRETVLSSRAAGVNPDDATVVELLIISVAENSAVAEVHMAKRAIRAGDLAFLSKEDAEKILPVSFLTAVGRNPNISAFTQVPSSEGPIRGIGPRASTTQERKAYARIGLDYSGIRSGGSTLGSSIQRGMSIQADITGIAGTHWNLQGYWRGRLTSNSQPLESTMQDYLDRTYTLQLFYANPESGWVAGVGRLYVPWAASLDTADGGYLGRRFGKRIIAGIFGGSTPDLASWHYKPDQQVAGSFVNVEGGSYDNFHYSSTSGLALNMLKWQLDRPSLFFENTVSYMKYVSVYHSLILDDPQGASKGVIKPGTGISRSYLTVHLQPNRRLSLDVYHNYFRDTPTTATQLIPTGLVDKLLYQGVNFAVRAEPVRHVIVYTTLGQSEKSGDQRRTMNQMYGVTWTEIGRSGLRADFHYSKFDSSFARGDYLVLSLSRHLGYRIVWDTQVGTQTLLSSLTRTNSLHFFDTSFDTSLGSRSFFQSGYTMDRGAQMNYEQWYVSLGYGFNGGRHRALSH